MKLFLNINPKLIAESVSPTSQKMPLDEIDAIADTIKTNMNKEVKIPKDVLNSFQIKNELNQDIWIKDTLNPKVRSKLIQIAKDFFKDLEIPAQAHIKDIIFTGSLANFNWSKYSDIDLHIVIDFDKFDAQTKFVEEYFYAQKSIWNQEHNIEVFSYPVELYVQDINAKLIATAVYSVLHNKWIKKPTHEAFELDKKAIKDKAEHIIYNLRDIRQEYNDHQYQTVVNKVKKLKDKIKQMRNAGLERGGEFSLENLVFKVLRRTTFMDQLDSFKAKAYDKLMSVSEMVDENQEQPQEHLLKPTRNDINKYMFTNEGFFNINNAAEFASKFLGYNITKLVGQGGNGAAYLTDKGTKLKFTFNENEFDFAKRSLGKKNSYMADYYRAEEIADGLFFIEMEYLQPLPNKTKIELKKMFDALLDKSTDYDKNLKIKVDNIKAKVGMFGNDLANYDNYGMKNGEIATFDPVSENILDEGEILDNTKFKYKRNEDGIEIDAVYENQLISAIKIEQMDNAYWFFEDEISEEQYDKLFPEDKFMYISSIETKIDKFKGEGIAKELMKRAIAKAKQQGLNTLALNASPMGTKGMTLNDLVGFYESFGFKPFLNQGTNVLMSMNINSTIDETNNNMDRHKIKKDIETKLGRKLLDSEWNNYLESGTIPKSKASLKLDPLRAAEIQQRQTHLQAKIAAIKARRGF